MEPQHTPGPLTYFVGNANGRGLIRIEAANNSDAAGEYIASMPRGTKSEANADRLVTGWTVLDCAERLIAAYETAMTSQINNGPDAKLMVLANYGEQALSLLTNAIRPATNMTRAAIAKATGAP